MLSEHDKWTALILKIFMAAKVDDVDPEISAESAIRIRFRMSEVLREEAPKIYEALKGTANAR